MKLLPITQFLNSRAAISRALFIPLVLFCCLFAARASATTVSTCMGTNIGAPSCTSSLTGGAWSSSNDSIATVNPSTGLVTPVAPGTVTITYSGEGACGTFSYTLTVLPTPSPDITGANSVCVEAIITLTASPAGGTWTSSNTSFATVGSSSGIVTGIAAGTTTIDYTVTNEYGCTASTTKVVSVNALPTVGSISGTLSVCVNATTSLTAAGSGTWSSSDETIATVGTSGIVTGMAAGTATIIYTVTDGTTGCQKSTTATVTVNPLPDPGTVAGVAFCQNATATLTSTAGSGTWTSGNTMVATVGSSSGIAAGVAGTMTTTATATITFTKTSGLGCTATTTAIVTVDPAPAAICCSTYVVRIGNTVTLTNDAAGGTWISSNTAVATVGSTGVVTGVTTGTVLIDYKLPNDCYASKLMTVIEPFSLSVCETAPMVKCGTNVFTYCPGFKLVLSGGPDDDWLAAWTTPTAIPTPVRVAASGTVPAGLEYSFTTTPCTGCVRTYTVTGSLGTYTTPPITVTIVFPASGDSPCDKLTPPGCSTPSFITLHPSTKDITVADMSSADTSSTGEPPVYYLPNYGGDPETLRVSPPPGSVIYVAKDRGFQIKAGDDITFDNLHIYTNFGGANTPTIQVNTSPTVMTKLKVKNSTLIENFNVGITVASYNPTAGYTPGEYILDLGGAIFNHNGAGVKINTSTKAEAYKVEDCVFTYRDLSSYGTECDAYPLKWPTTSYLKAETAGKICPIPKLNDFTGFPAANSIGMHLNGVGVTTGCTPCTYSSVMTIGDPADFSRRNLFDTLFIGIKKTNGTNAILYNNTFKGTNGSSGTGPGGIFDDNSSENPMLSLLKGTGDSTHNRFYNCLAAVTCSSCKTLISHYSEIRSDNYKASRSATVITNNIKAKYGFQGNSAQATKYEFVDNTIENVEVGIQIFNACGASVKINDNKILLGATSTDSTRYAKTGIEFAGCTTAGTGAEFEVNGNVISGMYDYGIKGTGNYSSAIVDDNDVTITHAGSNAHGGSKYGIKVNGTYLSSVTHNKVYGDGINVTYKLPGNGYRAIDLSSVGQSTAVPCTVSCNYVHDMEWGFLFSGTNHLSWTRNVMTRNKIGMYLSNSSIDEQGDACHPSDNYWPGTADATTGWPGWASTGAIRCYATVVVSVNPVTLSKLNVRGTSGFVPVNDSTYGGTAYTVGSSLSVTPTPCDSATNCSSYNDGASYRVRNTQSFGDDETLHLINGKTGIDFVISPNPAEDEISINSANGESEAIRVVIHDYSGRQVYNERVLLTMGASRIKLPVGLQGMYMVNIVDADGQSHPMKLIVNKNATR